MANTYTQIHIHFVFAPKFRNALIATDWEDELYKYITGIVRNHDHKMIAINGLPDHIHFLAGVRPNQSISELIQNVKGDSSVWINDKKFTRHHFEWQAGYGAFSYSKSQLPKLIEYIMNQKEHHKKRTFLEEYKGFLKAFDVSFEEGFIFKEPI
jgi:putative transposase